MPSATRKMKTNSGASAPIPGKSKTYSKKKAPSPSAAPNESTTVPIRTSGATTARRSATRMRNTSSSAIGTITRLSRADD